MTLPAKQTCILPTGLVQIHLPYDGVRPGDELIMAANGLLCRRRWGMKAIRRVWTFTVVEAGADQVTIQWPGRYGRTTTKARP